MSENDYNRMTRQQKLAVFLIIIGPEAAADVLRQFEDAEIELICREMSTFTVVPREIQKLSLDEFTGLISASVGSALGGLAYAQRTLQIAKGDQKASTIVDRIGPAGGTTTEAIKDISEMDGRQIFGLLRSEQPQTISFLLSYLDAAKAAEVFNLLGPELREDVIERLGTIDGTSWELASRLARSLGRRSDPKTQSTLHRGGGVAAVADLLKLLDKETSKNLLTKLEEKNATLSAAVRKKLFSFEDIIRLQPSDLQRVLREVDSANLATAIKAASETLRLRIYGSISKRAAESLKDEVQNMGAVKRKDVDAAQDAIIQVVRRLEEEGQISLEAETADSVA